jgi:hypothetical protein
MSRGGLRKQKSQPYSARDCQPFHRGGVVGSVQLRGEAVADRRRNHLPHPGWAGPQFEILGNHELQGEEREREYWAAK